MVRAALVFVALGLTGPALGAPLFPDAAHVERWMAPGSVRVVTSPEPDAATVAACVSRREDTVPQGVRLSIARRGGDIVTRDDVTCVVVPAHESAIAVKTALTLAERAPDTETADDVPGRLRRLAMEGTDAGEAPPVVLSVAGAITEEALEALTGKTNDAPPAPSPLAVRQSSERLSVLETEGNSPRVAWTWLVPESTTEVAAALAVASEVLTGPMKSRLPRLLVTERLLARHATGSLETIPGGTLASVFVESTTKTSVDRLRRFVDGTLKVLRLVGPTKGEVDRARARAQKSALETWEDPSRRAAKLLAYEVQRGEAGRFLAESRALARVTPEHVRRIFAERFVDARRTTVEQYPKSWPTDDPRLSRHQLYTVEPGDTLDDIAKRHHVPVTSLARANDLDPKRALTPGQPVWIPPR